MDARGLLKMQDFERGSERSNFMELRESMMQTAKKTSVSEQAQASPIRAYLSAGVGYFGVLASAEAGVVTVDVSTFNGVNAGLDPNAPSGDYREVSPLFEVGQYEYNGDFYPNVAGLQFRLRKFGGTGLLGSDKLEIGYAFAVGPTKFASAASIGSNPNQKFGLVSFTQFEFQYQSQTVTAPDFGPGSYLGFRVAEGPTYYGWIEVTWNSTSKEFQVLAMAYEDTPDTPILAGDTGPAPVPEPASSAVVALLMGGAALRQWRKKHRDPMASHDA
jgi:hypothetical protein